MPNIGQAATHDDAHRVVEIRPPHLVFDVDRNVALPTSVTPARSGREKWVPWWQFLACQAQSTFVVNFYFTKKFGPLSKLLQVPFVFALCSPLAGCCADR